jgi:TatA/E family protein of Tat protein translocase
MLGVGMQEMMIIGLAALLIFGPGKLPEVMSQAGKLYRDFRNMTAELTGEFDKTIAEAREMGNQITGELGPMQKELSSVTKSVERDLGGKKKTTSSSSKSTTAVKGTTGSKGTAARKSTSTASRSTSTSAKSTTSSRSSSASSTSTSTSKTTSTAKKEPAPVATRDDPYSDVSMFQPEPPKRERRARKATPAVITDLTPRSRADVAQEAGFEAPVAAITPVDDALARARARRRSAGYAKTGS